MDKGKRDEDVESIEETSMSFALCIATAEPTDEGLIAVITTREQ